MYQRNNYIILIFIILTLLLSSIPIQAQTPGIDSPLIIDQWEITMTGSRLEWSLSGGGGQNTYTPDPDHTFLITEIHFRNLDTSRPTEISIDTFDMKVVSANGDTFSTSGFGVGAQQYCIPTSGIFCTLSISSPDENLTVEYVYVVPIDIPPEGLFLEIIDTIPFSLSFSETLDSETSTVVTSAPNTEAISIPLPTLSAITSESVDRLTSLRILNYTGFVESVAFSPNGLWLASGLDDFSSNQNLRIWDVTAGNEYDLIQEDVSSIGDVAFSPDGTLLATGSLDYDDPPIVLWDMGTGQKRMTLLGHTYQIYSIAFSPDGLLLASGSGDHTLRLWDISTGENIATIELEEREVPYKVEFSPDGTLLAATVNNSVRLWDVSTATLLASLDEHTDRVSAIAFSPEGSVLASASSDNTVKLWDVMTTTVLTSIEMPEFSYPNALTFSPDGKLLASTSSHDVWLWDTVTSTNIALLTGHTNEVQTLSFNSDGTILASGSEDGTVRLWGVSLEDD